MNLLARPRALARSCADAATASPTTSTSSRCPCWHTACGSPLTPRATSPPATRPRGPCATSSRASPSRSRPSRQPVGGRTSTAQAAKVGAPVVAPAGSRGRTSDYSSLRRPEPKNAWERLLRGLRPPRQLKFTREGKYFLGITLGVGFAAINTGNNLLYLLLGMLLSLIVVSGVMSELRLRDLTVVRRLPPRAQVGRAHLVEIEVFNHKKRIPSYAIEVEDLRAGQPADKRCFFLKISPNSAQVAAYRRTPATRGRDSHVGFRIATRFPFGLFEKSREVPCEGELIIYPAVDPVRLRIRRRWAASRRDRLLGARPGDEIFGLRPMREGDDPRDIYWRKSTAARPARAARARARNAARRRARCSRSGVRPTSGDEWAVQFERRIREVASRAVAHIKRGDGVTIATTSGERVRADRSVGADPFLRFLALVERRRCAGATALPVPERRHARRPSDLRSPSSARRAAARRPPSRPPIRSAEQPSERTRSPPGRR